MCLASTRLVIAAVVFVATDLAGLLAFMSANSHKCDGRWEKIQTIVLLCMTGNERWWPEKSSFYPAMISVISFFFLWFSVGRNVESDSLTFEAIVHGLGDWQDWWNLREIELFFTAFTMPLPEQTELINFQSFLLISDLVSVAWQTESTIRFRNSSPWTEARADRRLSFRLSLAGQVQMKSQIIIAPYPPVGKSFCLRHKRSVSQENISKLDIIIR